MNRTIGKYIREIRKNKGKTQEELADLLNISQSAYQRIENGETTSWATHLKKLSEILNLNPEDLIANANNKLNNSAYTDRLAFQSIESINIVNPVWEKLIEQYEKRIKELNKKVQELESKIS